MPAFFKRWASRFMVLCCLLRFSKNRPISCNRFVKLNVFGSNLGSELFLELAAMLVGSRRTGDWLISYLAANLHRCRFPDILFHLHPQYVRLIMMLLAY